MTDVSAQLDARQKRELLSRLLAEKAGQTRSTYPLSYGQRALWFLSQLAPSSPAYNLMYAAHVRADLDHAAFSRAFQKVAQRHAVLRTTFGNQAGQPTQFVSPQAAWELPRVDATDWSATQLDAEMRRHAEQPFDLERGPLIRVTLFQRGGQPTVLLLAAHHIVLDFWSFDLLFDELEDLYRGEVEQVAARLPALPVQYQDYVRWQAELLDGRDGERLWDYWREVLAGDLPTLHLPTDRPRPPLQSYDGRSYPFQLSVELSAGLEAVAKEHGVTLYATLLAAFFVLLYRYSGQTDLLVGSPTAGRSRAELEPILGYFLNPIVLRNQVSPEQTFAELLAQTRDAVVAGIAHQDLPFPLLVQRLQPTRDASRSPIFQVAFAWDKPRRFQGEAGASAAATAPAVDDPGTLGLRPFALGQLGSAFDMMLMMLHMGDSLSAALQYNTALFDESTIARFVAHFQVLLQGVVADSSRPIASYRLITDEEAAQLQEWNDTADAYPREACVHQLVEQQAARSPARTAAAFGDAELTYAQLNERANQLANYLRRLGVAPRHKVGVCLDRSLDLLVGILGILKAGGAYVPLAPETPTERLTYMLEQSQADVLLTHAGQLDGLPSLAGPAVCLDRDWPRIAEEPADNLTAAAGPSDLAYVIFTSGSTGRPKGVEIEHRAVVNFLTSMQRKPGIEMQDVLLAVTTPTFDISVLELFLPLIHGARVVIASRAATSDGRQLAHLLSQSGASIMQATPATWRLLVESGWTGPAGFKALCGGEALPPDLAGQLLERCDSVWNMYGPTETTIWSAVDRVRADPGAVPIGSPIANTQLHILDQRLQAVPTGVAGDLYIGGDGLARGYVNQPELTRERFVPDPFSSRAGDRLYRTGDLARWRADGRIDFLGRQDFQVKVRGFRIELGEIEAHLSRHADVREAVVAARESGPRTDDRQLVAYYIPRNGRPVNTSELREFLKSQLPDYMLPAFFIAVDAFPLNPAGKVDRQALPAPDASRPLLKTDYAPPRDEREELLAEIWASILDLERVGVHDNFFELGGASIQSLEIALQVEQHGYQLTPALLFQHPTIAELAAALTAAATTMEAAASGETPVASELPEALDGAATAELGVTPAPQSSDASKTKKQNMVIESLGVYLPPKVVTTKEVVQSCRKQMWFPLEKMTGIHARRMAGEDEFSIDLAVKAATECMAGSRYELDDIDLVVCCNITRIDAAETVTVEPNTAVQLKQRLGLRRAEVFDVTNACAGMFTAMAIVDAFLQCGVIRRGLVVSGEFITDITRTAQKEISGFLDPRLACLTVGDAGAAVLLEAAADNSVGFHELEMFSLSKYSQMCIGRLTEQPHGGPIMHVPDPMRHTSIAVQHSVDHAQHVFQRSPWSPEKIQQLIMHQTSERSLRDGMRAINKAFGKNICHAGNTINNLAERGNTASTSHIVALWDNILDGRIQSGDNVLFGITGSGQTIGTGIYTLDDLPDRLRNRRHADKRPVKVPSRPHERAPTGRRLPRVRVHSIGTLGRLDEQAIPRDTTKMTALAAEACLEKSQYQRGDIGLLLFAGMLRTGYICEPAIATLIAGELRMNDVIQSVRDPKTLALDVYNGALGTLQACQVAAHMIQAGVCRAAMVTASEVEVNADYFPQTELGLEETASAMILDAAPDGAQGFGQFVFDYALDHVSARTTVGRYVDGKPFCDLRQVAEMEDLYLRAIPSAVDELLRKEELDLSRIKAVLPSQISPSFARRVGEALNFPADGVIQCGDAGGDLFTSSLPYALDQAVRSRVVQAGDIALIVNVAAGIQVGCATYYF